MSQLAPVTLYLWHLRAPAPEVAAVSACLSAAEQARAARFVRPGDGMAYRLGRGRLRHILAQWVGTAPEALSFTQGKRGKPALPTGPQFNLSHSGGLACLAVHPTAQLGVDIEAPRPIEDGVARRFFSEAEYAALSALPPEEWLSGFFRCWTRKEAVVKALGIGMGAPLEAFDVTLSSTARPAVTRMAAGYTGTWALAHLDLGPRWIGALALPGQALMPGVDVALCPADVSVAVSS